MNIDGQQRGRQHERRRTYTIRVLVDGEVYEIEDISVTGFLMAKAPDWMVAGQGINFHFVVDVNGDDTYIASNGTVVRTVENKLAVEYSAPHPKWDTILTKHLAQFG
ncbi:PilZ domain-containing protein [Hwanghaeella grinnelliae]|uniref:PilZ domain-containing protein n=1 Tax=Hwanghaeella grinnelliae TaxID=2500179 RepID=A0A437QGV8_9PROT|nr:PilZ domain-containing protein [Hwanghaeella grinnelliae]RVU33803.1 PilZ domain-containing protein [Hwanghaeella grinnelliae]